MCEPVLPASFGVISDGIPVYCQSFYVVNEAPEEGHHLSLGLLDKEMVAKYLNTPPSDDVLIVLCGPPAFRADMDSVLSKLGYTNVVVIDDM